MQIATPMVKYMTLEQIHSIIGAIVQHFGQSSVIEHIGFFKELLNINSWIPDNAEVCKLIAETKQLLAPYQQHQLWDGTPVLEVSNILTQFPNIGDFDSIQSYVTACFGADPTCRVSNIVSLLKQYYGYLYIIQNTNILEFLNQVDLCGESILTNELVELFYLLPNSLFNNFPFASESFPSQFIVNLFTSPIITHGFESLVFVCKKAILFDLFDMSLLEDLSSSIINSLFGYLPQDYTKNAFQFLTFLQRYNTNQQDIMKSIISEQNLPEDIAGFLNFVCDQISQLSEDAIADLLTQEDSDFPLKLEAFHLWTQCRP